MEGARGGMGWKVDEYKAHTCKGGRPDESGKSAKGKADASGTIDKGKAANTTSKSRLGATRGRGTGPRSAMFCHA